MIPYQRSNVSYPGGRISDNPQPQKIVLRHIRDYLSTPSTHDASPNELSNETSIPWPRNDPIWNLPAENRFKFFSVANSPYVAELIRKHEITLYGQDKKEIQFSVDRRLYMDRRQLLLPILCNPDKPVVIKSFLLDEALLENPACFKEPIPYAIWRFTREDFKVNVFDIYTGKNEFVVTVYAATHMWSSWNQNKLFTSEHWNYLIDKAKLKGILEDGIYQNNNDSRHFRGWDQGSLIVYIDEKRYPLGSMLPPYLRSSNGQVPQEIVDFLKHLPEEDDKESTTTALPSSIPLRRTLIRGQDRLLIEENRDTFSPIIVHSEEEQEGFATSPSRNSDEQEIERPSKRSKTRPQSVKSTHDKSSSRRNEKRPIDSSRSSSPEPEYLGKRAKKRKGIDTTTTKDKDRKVSKNDHDDAEDLDKQDLRNLYGSDILSSAVGTISMSNHTNKTRKKTGYSEEEEEHQRGVHVHSHTPTVQDFIKLSIERSNDEPLLREKLVRMIMDTRGAGKLRLALEVLSNLQLLQEDHTYEYAPSTRLLAPPLPFHTSSSSSSSFTSPEKDDNDELQSKTDKIVPKRTKNASLTGKTKHQRRNKESHTDDDNEKTSSVELPLKRTSGKKVNTSLPSSERKKKDTPEKRSPRKKPKVTEATSLPPPTITIEPPHDGESSTDNLLKDSQDQKAKSIAKDNLSSTEKDKIPSSQTRKQKTRPVNNGNLSRKSVAQVESLMDLLPHSAMQRVEDIHSDIES